METEKRSVTLIIAWVILLIMGLLMTLGGLESMFVAYRTTDGSFAGVSLQTLSQVNANLPTEIRARRATAASYATSCGLLVTFIAVTAFRKRQKWAWYALLCSLGIGAALSILRVPLLDHRPGAETAGATLLLLLIALGISYRDFR
jgi:Ca2+/H+ antiporter